jgi:glutamate N-acetyltransferase/amino-acid N-acetyltransferase
MNEGESMTVPQGFKAAAVKAGIKPSGGLDLALLIADGPCTAAGTFTTNRICAAPVRWSRDCLPSGEIRAVVVNAGNANAATGEEGMNNARRTAELVSMKLGCKPEQVLVASTGVIGHQLPMDRIEAGIATAFEGLSAGTDAFELASQAILTTDTRPKVYSALISNGRREYTVFGMAKGAAMIGPRMATMLAFLITDAPVRSADLQSIISEAVDGTFNCVSVEGHTSTNDSVFLLSQNLADEAPFEGHDLKVFGGAVRDVCERLAREMADDGEGATHLITIYVEGCENREQARSIARAVADSPLVKTAIHGADPNWGRIVSAAGYAGVDFREEELSLWINAVPVYQNGMPVAFDSAALSQFIRSHRQTTLRLVFDRGSASIRFWTCDLTAEYIRLNADYTT